MMTSEAVKSDLTVVPAERQFVCIAKRYGGDALLARLAVENWLSLSTSDYRNEVLRMFAVDGGALFFAPSKLPHYRVILPAWNHSRATLRAIEVGLLGTLLAYRELSPVAECFQRDFEVLKRFSVDLTGTDELANAAN